MMTMASLLSDAPTSRRGRPPAPRDLYIRCAALFFGSNWTVTKIAEHLDIDRSTVYEWLPIAMAYDDPAVDTIRASALTSPRARRWRHLLRATPG